MVSEKINRDNHELPILQSWLTGFCTYLMHSYPMLPMLAKEKTCLG